MPHTNRNILVSCCFFLVSVSAVASAEQKLELAAPFTHHMILQRLVSAPVWGFAAPGSNVTVEFANQKKVTVADPSGDWMVTLDPLTASREARTLKISNDRQELVVLDDVLVGEVWFSSGQSNMVWTAGSSMCNGIAREIAGSPTDIPIREINISTVSALYPQKTASSEGGWKTHTSASGFSALSLSFAYELYKALDVPIGILLSAHSLPATYGQDQVQFIYAQPTGALVEGITIPRTPNAKRVPFDHWPKSLKEIAIEMGRLAE